ncbi:MAG: hypothetical protein P0Y53_04930 [Candidatus Pseudobacter hemicellulosilyticus]|uniref:Uncharacterized protein n=1 Tax=Candidatus Pseudobacter hemicellulosilyticus TaxID=3121375 RepID=A0AAJ5WVD2_9BACT|nr:MAG: hypothetical protein P0Y53_04930 [Pseudobacter sp.]
MPFAGNKIDLLPVTKNNLAQDTSMMVDTSLRNNPNSVTPETIRQ